MEAKALDGLLARPSDKEISRLALSKRIAGRGWNIIEAKHTTDGHVLVTLETSEMLPAKMVDHLVDLRTFLKGEP